MVHIAIAPAAEHRTLNQLYLDWGYRGGIADGDIVYVAQLHGRAVGMVRRAREAGVLMLRGKSAVPAGLLVALVLGFAAWIRSSGVALPVVVAVACLAWRFVEAFGVARELAAMDPPTGESRKVGTSARL